MAESHYEIRKAPGIHCEIRKKVEFHRENRKKAETSVKRKEWQVWLWRLREAASSIKCEECQDFTAEPARWKIRENRKSPNASTPLEKYAKSLVPNCQK